MSRRSNSTVPRKVRCSSAYEATGLCHSDHHARVGDLPLTLPFVGGHEGAGIVQEVGPGVRNLAVGDHVVGTFMPACGRCRWCSSGQQNLCDLGAALGRRCPTRRRPSGRHARGRDIGALAWLGTFAQYGTVPESSLVKIDDDLPLNRACLVGCGVTTGWGSAVNTARGHARGHRRRDRLRWYRQRRNPRCPLGRGGEDRRGRHRWKASGTRRFSSEPHISPPRMPEATASGRRFDARRDGRLRVAHGRADRGRRWSSMRSTSSARAGRWWSPR